MNNVDDRDSGKNSDKRVGLPEIIGGALSGAATFFVGGGISHNKRMIEQGFEKGVFHRDVQKQIDTLKGHAEQLNNHVTPPDEFFTKDLKETLGEATDRFEVKKRLLWKSHQLETSLEAAEEGMMKDLKYVVGGAIIAAVATGVAIHFIRQRSTPDEEQVQDHHYEGALQEKQKIESHK